MVRFVKSPVRWQDASFGTLKCPKNLNHRNYGSGTIWTPTGHGGHAFLTACTPAIAGLRSPGKSCILSIGGFWVTSLRSYKPMLIRILSCADVSLVEYCSYAVDESTPQVHLLLLCMPTHTKASPWLTREAIEHPCSCLHYCPNSVCVRLLDL